jgi:diamine N-acetyltransferase
MLKGERVKLRAAEPADVDKIFEWENDPENWLVSNTIAPYSKHQILQFIESANDIFASNQLRLMITLHTGETVGCVDLFDFDPKNKRAGLGVLIDPVFRSKGLAREALRLTISYGFDLLELHGFYAEVLSSNESSQRLFESTGFTKTGMKKEWLWTGDNFVDQIFYQILR